MKNVKVSIIIPVYNSEKYIYKCLKSILNQSLKEIEVIIINDGSTDNSLNIIKEIASKDYRIKVFTQKNRGAASARNLGISKSLGKYIGFVDIDDYIEKDMYLKLYSKANEKKYDIVTCSFVEEGINYKINFENALIEKNEIKGNEIKKLYFKYIVDDKSIGYLPLWNKIFRRDFIINNNLTINEEMIFGEDRIFCREALLKANNVANINTILYHYVKSNDESLTMRYDIEKVRYYLQDRYEMIDFIKKNINNDELLEKGLNTYNSRIIYKIIDYAFKEINTDKSIWTKYKNIKEIFRIKEVKNLYIYRNTISLYTKILIILLKIECYPVIYICLFLKSRKIKLDYGI